MWIIKLWNMAYKIAKTVVGMAGIFLVTLLCIYSLVLLKAGEVTAEINVTTLITSSQELPYIWVGAFIIFAIGSVFQLGKEIKKGLLKARDKNISTEKKGKSLIKWLIEW